MTGALERIYLSPPHMTGRELARLGEVFESNWIAPLGPQVDAFEREFAAAVGCQGAAAFSSGTAAIHVALRLLGVGRGDEVLVPTFTFVGSVNPILYQGAAPVFIDSERESWNMDPELLALAIEDRVSRGRPPKAVLVVHIFGQAANMKPILATCAAHGIPVIEDAAEALGASYQGMAAGSLGDLGAFSFNGNKIITTSGGGMLVSRSPELIDRARWLASQAKGEAVHYEHSEVGYNYRLSNLLAAVGREQLSVLSDRVAARRRNFSYYRAALEHLPGFEFMPEASWGKSNRWLTCCTIDPYAFGASKEDVRQALEAENIEARPVWKPMHLQRLFRGAEVLGGVVAESLFERGLCLPSGSSLTEADLDRIIEIIRRQAAL